MTDLQLAKQKLEGHTISLYKDGTYILSEKRGIAPIMGFIGEGVNLKGYCVADTVVGKAAALLFVKCGIVGVYAKTLSKSGKAVLENWGIPCEYEVLTERIINRAGTDTCPMEKTVLNTCDPEEAYILLKNELQSINV